MRVVAPLFPSASLSKQNEERHPLKSNVPLKNIDSSKTDTLPEASNSGQFSCEQVDKIKAALDTTTPSTFLTNDELACFAPINDTYEKKRVGGEISPPSQSPTKKHFEQKPKITNFSEYSYDSPATSSVPGSRPVTPFKLPELKELLTSNNMSEKSNEELLERARERCSSHWRREL